MELEIAAKAQKKINSYDRPTRESIRAGVDGLMKTPPEGDIIPMQGYSDGRLRLRVGKYRIIHNYILKNGKKILYIIAVGARGDIYK